MRPRRSTAVHSSLLLSALLHGGALGAYALFSALASTPSRPPLSADMEVYSVPESALAGLDSPPVSPLQQDPQNTELALTPEQIAALPRDPEPLPVQVPSPDAVTDARGQIVEIAAPPAAQQAPEQADYLAQTNVKVEQEQASARFKINPEVVAAQYSDKSSLDHAAPGEAKARMRGEQNGNHGDAGDPSGTQQVAMRQPLVSTQSSSRLEPSPSELARPPRATSSTSDPQQAAPEKTSADPVASKPESMTSTSERAPDALLDAWSTEQVQARAGRREVLKKSAPTSPLLARLQPSLRPPTTPTPPPAELSGDTSSDARATSVPPVTERTKGQASGAPTGTTVAMLTPLQRKGQGQGGGDNGTAQVTFRQGELRGAPSNDRLNEKRGDSTLLNAREFRYFGYMQLIRRQVNFYWSQSLDNISSVQERLTRNEYTTTLNVSLDSKGNLKGLSLVRSCGVKRFDEATLQAFRVAAPFPPPPEGLLNASGDANLPEFGFTVTLGTPAPRYSGIDPRANVLFPGIVRP